MLALAIKIILRYSESTALVPAVLAQSVERVTAEREDAGSIPRAGPKKWRYFLYPAGGWTLALLGWPRKMADPSPVRDVKNIVPSEYFRSKYIDTQIKCIWFLPLNWLNFVKTNARCISGTPFQTQRQSVVPSGTCRCSDTSCKHL